MKSVMDIAKEEERKEFLAYLMTEDEKARTFDLAKRTGRDKKLARILSPLPEDELREMQEEYL